MREDGGKEVMAITAMGRGGSSCDGDVGGIEKGSNTDRKQETM